MPKIDYPCDHCGRVFQVWPSAARAYGNKSFCSRTCMGLSRRRPKALRTGSVYRTLKSGEPLPTRPPDRREVDSHGYITVSWNTPEWVRIGEHRYVMGNPIGKDVHHINGGKADNRVENLEIVSEREHGLRHRALTLDEQARVVDAYRAGAGLNLLARTYGLSQASIATLLNRYSVEMRPRRVPWGPRSRGGSGVCKSGHPWLIESDRKCRVCKRQFDERRRRAQGKPARAKVA